MRNGRDNQKLGLAFRYWIICCIPNRLDIDNVPSAKNSAKFLIRKAREEREFALNSRSLFWENLQKSY